MKELDQTTWKTNLKEEENTTILDVRTEEEYNDGHIPGAKLIDVQDPQNFMDHIEKLPKDGKYYIYCNSGNRGNQACLVMEHNGFKQVSNLEGGYQAWEGETE